VHKSSLPEPTDRLMRVCSVVAAVGGLVWVISGLVRPGTAYWNPHTVAEYATMASFSLGLLAFVAVFVGIRASPRWRAGLLGTIAIVLAGLGAAVAAVGNIVEDGLHVPLAAQLLFLPGMAALAVGIILLALMLLIRGGSQRWWAGPVALVLAGLALTDNGGSFLLALVCLVFGVVLPGRAFESTSPRQLHR
jgi:hypothetical protein